MSEKWYGFAGHLCVAERCAYHLCTVTNGYMISTVGAFYPVRGKPMATIGSGEKDLYETMVFRCSGEDEDKNPIADYSEIECIRYADSNLAEDGHYATLDKYRKEPHGATHTIELDADL